MWHPDIPGLQLSWDATSLKEIQHCPRKYFYAIVLGFKTEKESHHLSFGRKYHSCLEVYDKALANGLDWEEAQDLTVQRALQEAHGWDSGDKVKQRFSLWRTVQWYTEAFRPETDSVKPIQDSSGRYLIELPFSFSLPIMAPGGQDYIACGYFDGIVEAMGGLYVRERKTTAKTINVDWFKTFSVDAQIDMYSVASKIVFDTPVRGVLIDGAQVTFNFSRFGRYPSMRSEPQLEEFLEDLAYWIFQAETFATEGRWPKATRFCFWCPFQGVCAKDPASRTGALIGEFKVEDWDPTLDRAEA
jgi:hypothetical protein